MAIENYKEKVNENIVRKDCEKYEIAYNQLNEKEQNLLCAIYYDYKQSCEKLIEHYKEIHDDAFGINKVAERIGVTKQALYKKVNGKILHQTTIDYINKKKNEYQSFYNEKWTYYNREGFYDKQLMEQLLTHEVDHQQTKVKLKELEQENKRLNNEIQRLRSEISKMKS